MRKIIRLIVVTCVLIALSATAAQSQKRSLYERLGGQSGLQALVDEFITRVAADSRINGKFARTNIPRLKFYLVEQLCAATNGPCEYTGRDMRKTHRNMKVTDGEFDALVEDLVAALDRLHVASPEQAELLGILSPLKSQIVEVNSDNTGTPLPSNYKPASALSAGHLADGPKMKKTKSNNKKGKM